MNNEWENGLIEQWADIEHTRWSKWQAYLHSKCVEHENGRGEWVCFPAELFKRWERQINTPYAELSEAEKESDRDQVRPYLPSITSLLDSERADWLRSEIEKLEGIEDILVKHLVDRFLGWHLPKDFHPDGGISFDREYNVSYNANQGLPPSIHEPTGTNLFTAEQAKEMFRFLLENEDGTSALTSIITRYKEELLELTGE